MNQLMTLLLCLSCTLLDAQTIANFENFNLMEGEYLNSSQPENGFKSGNILLPNSFSGGFWSGWAISATSDTTTPGFQNEYSAIAGGGAKGSTAYAVAYVFGGNVMHLTEEAAGGTVAGLYITNSTYAFYSILEGDDFAKKFGGEDGNDPDYFLLTVKKYLDGQLSTDSIDFYLADYRSSDNSQDYIIQDWTYLDLAALGAADSLLFTLSSSDVGLFGMNTPAYFCIDDVETTNDISSLEPAGGIRFSLFPNPASEFILIEPDLMEGASFTITDILGKFVKSGKVSDGRINLCGTGQGNYFLTIENGEGLICKPFFIAP